MQKPRHPDSLRSVLLLSAFSLSLILTQSGCPQGADLENPEAWAGRFGTGPGPSSGGTGQTGLVLDFTTVICPESLNNANTPDPASADFINATCGKQFCHGKNFVVGLDLRADSGFASRTLDVLATHAGIPCEMDITMDCIPASCPAPGTAKIIDSGDPTASWLLTKVHGGQLDCGGAMPDANALSGDKDTCIQAIVTATAALK